MTSLRDGRGPIERALRRSLDRIGVDPYDVNLAVLAVTHLAVAQAPQSRFRFGSPCAASISLDYAIHVLLAAMVRERYPRLSARLARTSPRWKKLCQTPVHDDRDLVR